MSPPRVVVGLSGATGAGKTTAGRLLEKAGYSYHRFSQVLERMLIERGERVSREALQCLGREIHHNPGQRWLCERIASEIPTERNAVIDGLRYREDHECLADEFGPAFFHIHIEVPSAVRHARGLNRGDSERTLREASGSDFELPLLRSLAHAVIQNIGDVQTLKAALDEVVERKRAPGAP